MADERRNIRIVTTWVTRGLDAWARGNRNAARSQEELEFAQRKAVESETKLQRARDNTALQQAKLNELDKKRQGILAETERRLDSLNRRERDLLATRERSARQEEELRSIQLRRAETMAKMELDQAKLNRQLAQTTIEHRKAISVERDREAQMRILGERFGSSTNLLRRFNIESRVTLTLLNQQTGAMRNFRRAWERQNTGYNVATGAITRFISRLILLITLMPALATLIVGLSGTITALVSGLGALTGALSTLSGVVVALPAGLFALGGAFASVLAILGPGIRRISAAVDELKKARDSVAGNARDAGAQRAIADAEKAIARARVDGVARVRDAELRLRRTRMDSAKEIAEAERQLIEARRDGARSVADAERSLADQRRQAAERERDLRIDIARAQRDAAERLRDAEERLVEVTERSANRQQEAAQKLADTREGAAQRLLDLEERLADVVETSQERQADAAERVAEIRLRGIEQVTRAEERLLNLRERNARDEEELERALFNARATLQAELLRGGDTRLAQAGVGESERDLAEFQRQARAAEAESAQDLETTRRNAAESIADAEERLADTILDNAERISDAQADLLEEREDGPQRIADAERDLTQIILDGQRDIRDATESIVEARRDGAERVADLELSLSRALASGRGDVAAAELRLSRARVDSAERIASAERRLDDQRISAARSIRDAEQNLSRTRVEVARSLADASDRLADAQNSAATASARQLEEFNKLTPVQQQLATGLVALADRFRQLTAAASDRAFRFFLVALREIQANLVPIAQGMNGFIFALIGVGQQLLALSRDRTFRDNFGVNVQNSYVLIQNLGRAFVAFIDLLNTWTAAAAPFTAWLSDTVAGWVEYLAALARVNQENGKLGTFFAKTQAVFTIVTSTLKDLFTTLKNIGSIGFPFGVQILRYWEELADRADKYTKSARGQKEIREFFRNSVPVFIELNRLLGAIVATIFRMGNAANEGGANSGLARFFRLLRVEFLPAFERFAIQSARVFGPLLLKLFRELGTLVGHLSAPNGPLATVIWLFTRIIAVLNAVPAPVLRTVLTLLVISRVVVTLGGFLLGFAKTLGIVGKAVILFGRVLVAAFLANPALFAAIVAIGLAAVLIIKYWDKIVPFFKSILSALSNAFRVVTRFLDRYVVRPLEAVLDFVRTNWQTILKWLLLPWLAFAQFIISRFGSNIVGAITGTLSAISSAVVGVFSSLASSVSAAWGTIVSAVTTSWQAIVDFFTGLPQDLFSSIIGPMWDLVLTGVQSFFGLGRSIGGAIGDGVKAGWDAVVDFFKRIPRGVISGVLDFVWDSVKKGVTAYWGLGQAIGGIVGDVLSGAWRAIKGFFASIPGNAIRVLIDPIWNAVKTGATTAWGFVTGVGSTIYGAVRAIIDFFTGLPGEIGNAISKAFASIWLSIRNGIAAAWTAAFNVLKSFVNKLIDAFNWIADKVPGVDRIDRLDTNADTGSLDTAPGGWAPTPKPGTPVNLPRPSIPAAAEGGILHPVAGGVYRVVEAGHPEGVVPLDPGKRPRAWRVLSEIMRWLGPPPTHMQRGDRSRVTRDRFGRPGFADGGLLFPVLGGARRGGGPGGGTHSRTEGPPGREYQWQDDDAFDLHAPAGTYIVAIRDGVITNISGGSSNPRYAGFGITQDGNIFYKHLATARVRIGQRVKAGQILGDLHAATAGGPHLHFAMRELADLFRVVGLPPILGGIAGVPPGSGGGNPFEGLINRFRKLVPDLPKFPDGMAGDLMAGLAKFFRDKIINAAKDAASLFSPGNVLDRVTSFAGGLFGGGGRDDDKPGAFADDPRAQRARLDDQGRFLGKTWGNPTYRGGYGSGPIGYNPSGIRLGESSVRFIASAALSYLGIPVTEAHISALVATARKESTFHTGIINQNDSNWLIGTPSIGLMQTIGPTFDAFKVKGFDNIWDPFHNMLASIRYQLSEYGGIRPQLRGYDVGGVIEGPYHGAPQPILGHVGEWVLNDEQQMRGARLVGSWQRFRDYIFEGRVPDSSFAFADGGIVSRFGMGATAADAKDARGTGDTFQVNQRIYTQQVEADLDYIMRRAEQGLRRRA